VSRKKGRKTVVVWCGESGTSELLLQLISVFRSSPSDDVIDWNSGLSVHPSVHISIHKKFSDFNLIWCVGRPRPDMHTSMTLTRSKVKVKGH